MISSRSRRRAYQVPPADQILYAIPQCQISSSSGSARWRYLSSATASDMATLNNEKALVWLVTGVTLDVRLRRVALLAHNVCTSLLHRRLHRHRHDHQ